MTDNRETCVIDPAHEVPPRGLLPDRSQRPRPHIYSEAEMASIIAAAKALPSIYGLRGLTYSTLFGLISVTGLRISEALALDHDDLDVENGVLRVRRGKLGKERLLPLDSTSNEPSASLTPTRSLQCWRRQTDRPGRAVAITCFFSWLCGPAYAHRN
jgi:integrase